jgi:hypothetical protein
LMFFSFPLISHSSLLSPLVCVCHCSVGAALVPLVLLACCPLLRALPLSPLFR